MNKLLLIFKLLIRGKSSILLSKPTRQKRPSSSFCLWPPSPVTFHRLTRCGNFISSVFVKLENILSIGLAARWPNSLHTSVLPFLPHYWCALCTCVDPGVNFSVILRNWNLGINRWNQLRFLTSSYSFCHLSVSQIACTDIYAKWSIQPTFFQDTTTRYPSLPLGVSQIQSNWNATLILYAKAHTIKYNVIINHPVHNKSIPDFGYTIFSPLSKVL